MSHHHHHASDDPKQLALAFALNFGFTLAEIVGGLAINSVAVLSDAVHDLGDSFALGLAWFLARYAQKDSDHKYSYGYRRFSLLGALINALILVIGAVLVLSEALPRLLHPEDFNAPGMIVFALAGITINGLATLRLREGSSANVRVVQWHLLEDVLGWVAVLIVGLIALVVDLPILDPLLSIGITLFVLYNVLGTLKQVTELFLQAVPSDTSLAQIETILCDVEGVQSAHHVHVWSLDGEHIVLTAHLVVDGHIAKEDAVCVKQDCKAALQTLDLHLEHVTLEVEYSDEDCSMHPVHDH